MNYKSIRFHRPSAAILVLALGADMISEFIFRWIPGVFLLSSIVGISLWAAHSHRDLK